MNIYTALPGIAAVSLLTAGATLVTTSQPAAANGLPAVLTAAEQEKAEQLEGRIATVSASQNQFTLLVGGESDAEPRRVTVKVNDETAYMLDGEKSTMQEALKPNRMADVEVEDQVATSVSVTTRAE